MSVLIFLRSLVSEATHLAGGRIDQAWCNWEGSVEVDATLYSPYYTCKDHDALLFTTYDKSSGQVEVEEVPPVLARRMPVRTRKPMQGRQT